MSGSLVGAGVGELIALGPIGTLGVRTSGVTVGVAVSAMVLVAVAVRVKVMVGVRVKVRVGVGVLVANSLNKGVGVPSVTDNG